jgi:hypothetical protein
METLGPLPRASPPILTPKYAHQRGPEKGEERPLPALILILETASPGIVSKRKG